MLEAERCSFLSTTRRKDKLQKTGRFCPVTNLLVDKDMKSNKNLTPQKKMFRSPDNYGYLTAYYQIVKNFNVSLSGTYTGSMLVQHFAGYIAEDREKKTPDFYDMNVKLSYDFKINASATLQLNAGVQNIFNSYQNDFDKGEFRDAGYIYGPALPRSISFGAKIII